MKFLGNLSKLGIGLSFIFASVCQADPSFTNLSETDFEKVSKELSANFIHHSVQGAAPLGDIWGFEVGLLAGATPVPDSNALIKRSGGSDMSQLYHTGILGALSVPFGITGEMVVIPRTTVGDLELEKLSLALKLSLNTHLLQVIPFNLAVRGFTSSSKFTFKQTSGGVNGTIEDKNSSTGIQLLASPVLPIFEPYVGIGTISAKNALSVSGTGSVFSNSYTTSQSADVSVSSTQYLVGLNADLVFVTAGLEYSSAFGTHTYSGKLAFGF